MARWSKDQIAAGWILLGGPLTLEGLPGKSIPYVMADIAVDVESSGDPDAKGPLTSYGHHARGLFQIHPPPADATDPIANIGYAIAKAKDGLHHWTNHAAGNARIVERWRKNPDRYTRKTERLMRRLKKEGTSTAQVRDASLLGGGGFGGLGRFGLGGPDGLFPDEEDVPIIGGALGAIDDTSDAVAAIANFLMTLAQRIGDPDFWRDVGKVSAGAWILLMGLRRIFRIAT